MAQHSTVPKLIAFDDARVPVPCFVRVAIFWSHQFALMALSIGLVATPFFELNDWSLLALIVSSLVFPFPWAFRRLCDEYFWRVSDVKGKVSIHDSWAKKIAARSKSQTGAISAPAPADASGDSPTPRSRSHSRDNTPEREVRSSNAPQPTSGMATPRRSRSSSRDAPPTSGRATPRRSSSRSGDVVAQAAASSEQANKEFLAFRQRERERRAMSFPTSALVLLFLAMISTVIMAVWTAARYSVEFEVLHHTMWGATYGMAVLFHLAVLEPLMCIILELRELFSSYTKVNYSFVILWYVVVDLLTCDPFQALRNKVAAINASEDNSDKPAAAATVSSNIFGTGGTFFQRKLRTSSVNEAPKPSNDVSAVRSIVPAPPARRAGPQDSASLSAISALYEVEPRVLDSHASDGGGYIAPSASAAPAFLRRQRSGRKEDA